MQPGASLQEAKCCQQPHLLPHAQHLTTAKAKLLPPPLEFKRCKLRNHLLLLAATDCRTQASRGADELHSSTAQACRKQLRQKAIIRPTAIQTSTATISHNQHERPPSTCCPKQLQPSCAPSVAGMRQLCPLLLLLLMRGSPAWQHLQTAPPA